MELSLIGAGIGGSINHTSELWVLNLKKAMQSLDAGKWIKEIENKKAQLDKYNAHSPIRQDLLLILTTMWAMKLKSNRTHRGRLNDRGYEQVYGSHFTLDFMATPVNTPSL